MLIYINLLACDVDHVGNRGLVTEAMPPGLLRGALQACAWLLLLAGNQSGSASADETFRFLSIGDWGTGSRKQKLVAKVLGDVADRLKPKFVISLGDNIYYFGAKHTRDKKWHERFEKMYDRASLQVPWCAVAGNHDWGGGTVHSQVDYHTENPKGKWYMPGLYYTRTWALPQGKRLQVVFVDTVLLAPNQFLDGLDQVVRRFFRREKREVSLAELREKGDRQREWLTRTLQQSTADWLLVAGHYPLYSAGPHGDSAEMLSSLQPLLDDHDVVAYLCGHDHSLQHLAPRVGGGGTHYFVSGAGGAATSKVRETPERRFAVQDLGFLLHEISGDVMRVSIIGSQGDTLYTTELAPRRRLPTKGGDFEQGEEGPPSAAGLDGTESVPDSRGRRLSEVEVSATQ